MSVPHVTVIPVGRIEVSEVEAVLPRVSKVLHAPVDLGAVVPLPKGTEDAGRHQHASALLLSALRGQPGAKPAGGITVYVTDVDLFSPATDAALVELDVPHRVALVSVRRLREAFYRRKADPAKQRARLTKEVLRAIGRLAGLPDCGNPDCALAPTRAVSDLDHKAEHYCAPCWKRLSTGTMRI